MGECPEGKVFNKVSKRCVSRDGKLGKKILKDMKASPSKKSPPKKSPPKKSPPKKSPPKKSPPKKSPPKKSPPKKSPPKKSPPKKSPPKKSPPKKSPPKKASPKKKSLPKKASPPKKKSPPKKASTKKASPKKVYTFIEGIYILFFIRCLLEKKIKFNNLKSWSKCFTERFNDKDIYLSFMDPYNKLKDNIEEVKTIIEKSYKNFEHYNLVEIYSFFKDYDININQLYKFFDLLEGVKIERIEKISYDTLENYNKDDLSKLKELWKQTYPNDTLKNVSKMIKGSELMLKYGKDGCIEKSFQGIPNEEQINKILTVYNNIKDNSIRMDKDFYVYRTAQERKGYRIEEKISKLLSNEKIIEHYPTVISTAWELDFVWNRIKDVCCIYIIKVPKDSDYLIIYDSFKEEGWLGLRSESEITLNPGTITITDIKYCDHGDKTKIIFFAEYKSYKSLTKADLEKKICQ
jgi:hypothetical protein